jgi:hypothetical protein
MVISMKMKAPLFLSKVKMENLNLKEEQLGTSILQPRAM